MSPSSAAMLRPASPPGPHAPEPEPHPVEIVAGSVASGAILLCDHASNAVPPDLGDLGLSPEHFARHIAYDIGAAAVTRGLARRLGAPAVLTTFSRLVIDPNRGRDDPTLVMRLSDGAVVPGNRRIGDDEVARRIRRFYDPYDAAITEAIERALGEGTTPALVSIHSFTPIWRGTPRPWHVGLLWDVDRRLSKPLVEGLERAGDLVVGDNEPYDGALAGDTLERHATRRGLANVLIEIRQDLIADEAGAEAWAERLARLLRPLLADPALRAAEQHGTDAHGRAPARTTGGRAMKDLDAETRTELEAAAFRRLTEHLRARPDVQNLDLMNLAGFCRNCLSNWLKEAADARGLALTREESREHVYGMPYDEWKAKHQSEATPTQLAGLEKNKPAH